MLVHWLHFHLQTAHPCSPSHCGPHLCRLTCLLSRLLPQRQNKRIFRCFWMVHLPQIRHAFGTVRYSSPEMARDRAGQKSDVWSAGVVVYHILAGRVPFLKDTDHDTLKLLMKNPQVRNVLCMDALTYVTCFGGSCTGPCGCCLPPDVAQHRRVLTGGASSCCTCRPVAWCLWRGVTLTPCAS